MTSMCTETEVSLANELPDQVEECAICWNTYNTPVTTQCQHTFCKSCLRTQLMRNISCPMCRECIVATTPPLGPRSPDSELVTIYMDSSKHWGLTVSTHEGAARVEKVTRGDAAERNMFRPGDHILSMNGIPCRSHHDCTRMIKQLCVRDVQSITVELKRTEQSQLPNTSTCFDRFFPCLRIWPRFGRTRPLSVR